MSTKSMTAQVSAFVRAYHAARYPVKVFDDTLAGALLPEGAYQEIAGHLTKGISFFCPGFQGTEEETLERIVSGQLSPTPLQRAAFAEAALRNAVSVGAGQYLILGAGYDTFGWRQPLWAKKLEIFELDRPGMAQEKQRLLEQAGLEKPDNLHFVPADFTDPAWKQALAEHTAFDRRKITFCSLLGLVYYLPEAAFGDLVSALGELLPKGSALAFDYPGETTGHQAQLAAAAGEAMQASYRYRDMEALLAEGGFLIYEHLGPEEITERFFTAFNQACPNCPMAAESQVYDCLAVRQ